MAPVSMSTSENQSEKLNSSNSGDINEDEDENEIQNDERRDFQAKDGARKDDGITEQEKLYPCREDSDGELNESETEVIDKDNEDEWDRTITVDENQAPDGGWGWFIVLGALLLRTVIGGLGRSHGLFYIQFKERFHGTATSTALVTSLTGFLRLAAGPVVSILSGRFRCRILTSIGTLVLFIGVILTGFGPNLQFLYFSYGVVAGLGRALTLTPVPIQLGYYFNKRRSLAFGVASAGFSIGGFVITPIVELLFQHYGYQGTFLILSGFALNILVSSALFRPIEIHRRLTMRNRNVKRTNNSSESQTLVLKSLEQIESGAVTCSSTVSINNVKSNDIALSISPSKTHNSSEPCQNSAEQQCCSEKIINNLNEEHKQLNGKGNVEIRIEQNGSSKLQNDCDNESNVRGKLLAETSGDNCDASVENSAKTFNKSNAFCCFTRKQKKDSTQKDSKKKVKLISWSVLKNTRFQCFVFATFCFTLPTSTLFLPALAKSKGVSDIRAATLLSMSAGCDTVFRVISGFVLDLKLFRSIRPVIYNFVTFLQAVAVVLFPLMTSYSEFLILCAIEGVIVGIKNAQGSVVMMDILGVDKLASSLAVTMSVQCIAVFLGPTISGQLIDRYGSYDGAFYFGAGAILIGAIVMAAGNIAKYCRDSKAKKHPKNTC